MDDLVSDFISETSESLLNLDNELVELESNPDNVDLLSKIFRVMHTIKGTCGFLGLNKLASVAHAAENILDKMRSKKIPVDSKNISILLEAIDTIKSIVSFIQENDGAEPQIEYGWLIDKINNTLNAEDPSKPSETPVADLDKLFENKAAPVTVPGNSKPEESIEPAKITEKEEIKKADQPPVPQATPAKPASSSLEDEANQAIRVKLEVLDDLMQTVSELVLTRNQLLQIDRTIRNDNLSAGLQNLNFITTSIQELVMSTRMQPISNAWIKVPRMIRDLSKELNKKIKLEMIGKETELDRQLIESIKDPLVHMIRNSADHGLESEEIRIAAGKSAEGTITLQAYHSSGNIIVEVSDDGAGIDIAKVKSKIIEKKLATELEIEQMTEKQIIQYIFRAGFSTSDKVTALSGRGVGMDVVKTNIESIKGSVEIKTTAGKGSTFVLKIPLTLAIMPILVVDTQNQKFGIPQSSILEMLRIGKDSNHHIEQINEHLILRLRESLIPLVKLSEILQLESNTVTDSVDNDYYIVICEVRGKRFGIIVENIYDTEEIVLKPLSKLLESINVYSGTTLLGNGDIIIIVAPDGIAQNIALLNTESSNIIQPETKKKSAIEKFLILKCNNSFKAIPLELVLRLEEIDVSKIETVAGKKVVQYMNSLMYLEMLDSNYKIPKKGKQQVVVFIEDNHILGLVVEKIVDIVSQDIENNLSFDQSNLKALVLDNKTMDIVNISDYFVELSQNNEVVNTSENLKFKILLVEDSPYFNKLLAKLLKNEGFTIFTVRTSEEAIKTIENNDANFDLLLIDTNINANDLMTVCQQNPKTAKAVTIGLILNNEAVKQSSEEKLFNYYVNKLNKDELVKLIYSNLNSTKQE